MIRKFDKLGITAAFSNYNS